MRVLSVVVAFIILTGVAAAQAPASKPAAQAPAPKAAGRAPSSGPDGRLAQVMRGILFPNSNLVFDVQQNDPGAPPKKSEGPASGAGASTTYANIYTGWQVVENAAIAMQEAVDFILKPGRLCQNGKPVPLQRADFRKAAAGLRTVSKSILMAAREKNKEKVSDLANDLADACAACHEIYRDKGDANSPLRCAVP